MLYSRCPVVVNILLDLALPPTGGRLVQWHLDGLIPVGHHDGAEGTVLSVHLRRRLRGEKR